MNADGFQLHQSMVAESVLGDMEACVSRFQEGVSPHGVRNLFSVAPGLRKLVKEHVLDPLGVTDSRPVRAVYFDKTEQKNWNVAWHQDTTVEIVTSEVSEGFRNAKERDGHICVEPPLSILRQMQTFRIHLDNAGVENGCLRVVPGSHRAGRTSSDEILRLACAGPVIDLEARRGDVLVMHPLLFHSSRKAQAPFHRRVIHIECCSAPLPLGMRWFRPGDVSVLGRHGAVNRNGVNQPVVREKARSGRVHHYPPGDGGDAHRQHGKSLNNAESGMPSARSQGSG